MVVIRFGRFTLDTDKQELAGAEGPIHLSPKAFFLLEALIRARPRIVQKSELLDEVWPDVHVEEQNVKNLIVEIRRALGDEAASPRFIRNAFGRGYSFCGTAWELLSVPSAMCARLFSSSPERAYAVRDGENVIGRDPACSIILDWSGVSRQHAAINVGEGKFVLRDLGSKNGTWLNGECIRTDCEIEDGDEIRIGTGKLVFRKVTAEDSTSTIIET